MRPLGEPFGSSWALFGVLGRPLGPSWALLGSSLGPLGHSLGRLEGLLGPLGRHLEASWDPLGNFDEKNEIFDLRQGAGTQTFGGQKSIKI